MLRMLQISEMNCFLSFFFVKALLSESIMNSPGLSPRMVIKLRIAATGQRIDPVQSTIMSDPTQNWSHFDFFRLHGFVSFEGFLGYPPLHPAKQSLLWD